MNRINQLILHSMSKYKSIFKSNLFRRLIATLIYSTSIVSFQPNHFYRAAYLPKEPRFEKARLNTLEVLFAEGKTSTAFNECADQVSIFSLFSCDKQKCLKGTFELFETWITFTQNFNTGLFFEYTIPVTQFFLKPFSTCKKESEYLYLYNCCKISNACELFSFPRKQTALSDCITLLGWTTNYEECEELDFIDATFKTGVIWPTGTCIQTDGCLSIPNGYGHWGFPLSGDLSFGALDWFTLGFHLDALLFLGSQGHTQKAKNCYNYIYRKPGTITTFSTYGKADHFILNLSLALGYTYSHKSSDTLAGFIKGHFYSNETIHPGCNFYTNPYFNEWSLHTIR